MSRSRLKRRLDDLFSRLDSLEAREASEFKVAGEDKKVMMGSQVYLSRYKDNFVEIYTVYEQIADTQVKIANLANCASKEKERLLNEALQSYNEAIEGLKYIRKTPSLSLLSKHFELSKRLENTRKPATSEAMELQPPQESSDTLSAVSTPSLGRSMEMPARTRYQPSLFQLPTPAAPTLDPSWDPSELLI